jgi:hypothetical protein
MKQKRLTIHFTDGTTHTESFAGKPGFPIGAPVNDMSYIQFCIGIGQAGWLKEATKEKVVLVPSSQIKSIVIDITE